MSDIALSETVPMLSAHIPTDHQDDVVEALAHLRKASAILDSIVAEDASRVEVERSICHRITEASHVTHRAVLAVTECMDLA